MPFADRPRAHPPPPSQARDRGGGAATDPRLPRRPRRRAAAQHARPRPAGADRFHPYGAGGGHGGGHNLGPLPPPPGVGGGAAAATATAAATAAAGTAGGSEDAGRRRRSVRRPPEPRPPGHPQLGQAATRGRRPTPGPRAGRIRWIRQPSRRCGDPGYAPAMAARVRRRPRRLRRGHGRRVVQRSGRPGGGPPPPGATRPPGRPSPRRWRPRSALRDRPGRR